METVKPQKLYRNNQIIKSKIFPTYMIIFHVGFIIFMGFFGKYRLISGSEEEPRLYPSFGFLMTFLKRHGYGSIGFTFLVAAYVLEWALLVRGWLESGSGEGGVFYLSTVNLIVADFVAASVLISFGAVLGKASLSQLIIMATLEVVVQSVNEHIGVNYLKAYDVGESIYVHVFGAYFGLAVAFILQIRKKPIDAAKESSLYHSDLFAMIGTIFLWLYWPSFNSATAKDEGQVRAIVNTYLSIVSSCICTYVISLYVGNGRLNMIHIQNATLAGGVAVGTVADMAIQPFGAMIIGSVAGVISTFGFQYLTPKLNHGILHDTCGVNNLHGMPGLMSGIASAIVAAVATQELYNDRIPSDGSYNSTNLTDSGMIGLGRTALEQGGYQLAALVMTLSVALVSGVITGFILKLPFIEQIAETEDTFNDEPNWIMPEDFSLELLKA